MLVHWRRGRSDPDVRPSGRGSAWAALVVAVSLTSWLVSDEVDSERLVAGVHQRVATGTVLVWLLVTAAHLLARTRGADRP